MSQSPPPRPKPRAPRPTASYEIGTRVVIDRPDHPDPIYGKVCGQPGAGGAIPVNYLTDAGIDSVWLAHPDHISVGWA